MCQELQRCWVFHAQQFPVYQEWSTTQRTSRQLETTVGSIGVNMSQHPCGMLSTPCRITVRRIEAVLSAPPWEGGGGCISILYVYIHLLTDALIQTVQCPSPVVPLGGQVSCEAPSHPWGSVCNFSCDEGYDHQGAPNMQCSRSGEWSAETPTCTATPEPPLNPTILGLAAGGAVSLSGLSLAAWLLKRIRQKANKIDLNSTSDIEEPLQTYRNSIDSLI
ncbi:E-selectin-like [Oncorhynchus kisutch]|uniref:E-selectin-like n=1 Tax=Oncorhynchus kisutch TaxID=8019 RepID=UPI0012DEF955|nr:E-selectin-like [Oncorhynchus kisutch]